MSITAEFVTSAASAADLPTQGLPEVALVGRSNVGKSSLINALTRRRLARTSARPGKTRLLNLYRIDRGAVGRLWLVDLPGFGYARGGPLAAASFDALTQGYFARARGGQVRLAALLLVDVRHPGLASDRRAWAWLQSVVERTAIVATKIDKLGRGERTRAVKTLEAVFENPVLPVSAVTDEGLDELWILISRLASTPHPRPTPRPAALPRRR